MTISLPGELARYVVEKGSITVDGVSLTIAGLDGTPVSRFRCTPLPGPHHAGTKQVGDPAEPLGGRAGQVCRATVGRAPMNDFAQVPTPSPPCGGPARAGAHDTEREEPGRCDPAAELATAERLAWTIRHTSGYPVCPLPERVGRPAAPAVMVVHLADPRRTAYTGVGGRRRRRHHRDQRRRSDPDAARAG